MKTNAATEQYARGIYNAFAAYKKRHGGSITIPYMPDPIEEKAPVKAETKKEEPQKEETSNVQEPQPETPQASVTSMVEAPPTSVTPELQEKPELPEKSKASEMSETEGQR